MGKTSASILFKTMIFGGTVEITRSVVKRVAVWALFLTGLSPCFAFGETGVVLKAQEQFQFAESYFRNGEYYRAIGEYHRFIHFFPNDKRVPSAMYKVAESYFKGERFKQAIQAFESVIDKYPGSDLAIQSYLMIGECHARSGHPEAALIALDNLLRLTQDTDVKDAIHYRQGWIYLEMNQWEKARVSFNKISAENRNTYRLKQLSEDLDKKKSLKTKNPKTAGALAIIPGAGHLYCKRYQDAFIAFLLNGVTIWAAVEAFDDDNEGLGVLLTVFGVGLYSGNIYSAVNCAHKYNRKQQQDFLQYLKDHSKVQLSAGPMNDGYAMAVSFKIAF
jgi:tetratricopeptide (TPR) repeat protein